MPSSNDTCRRICTESLRSHPARSPRDRRSNIPRSLAFPHTRGASLPYAGAWMILRSTLGSRWHRKVLRLPMAGPASGRGSRRCAFVETCRVSSVAPLLRRHSSSTTNGDATSPTATDNAATPMARWRGSASPIACRGTSCPEWRRSGRLRSGAQPLGPFASELETSQTVWVSAFSRRRTPRRPATSRCAVSRDLVASSTRPSLARRNSIAPNHVSIRGAEAHGQHRTRYCRRYRGAVRRGSVPWTTGRMTTSPDRELAGWRCAIARLRVFTRAWAGQGRSLLTGRVAIPGGVMLRIALTLMLAPVLFTPTAASCQEARFQAPPGAERLPLRPPQPRAPSRSSRRCPTQRSPWPRTRQSRG